MHRRLTPASVTWILSILHRYARPGTLFGREFAFRLLGDFRGKTILDVGCGEGEDALILAKLGGDVTGIDLSAGAIRVARERTARNHVVANFICSPVEELSDDSLYDIVWVEALLHHDFTTSITSCGRWSRV